MVIFLTSNKKKQILKSTGKAVLIIGCVALFSYFGISYLELLSKIENGEVMIGKFRENINSIVKSFNNYGKNLYWSELLSRRLGRGKY